MQILAIALLGCADTGDECAAVRARLRAEIERSSSLDDALEAERARSAELAGRVAELEATERPRPTPVSPPQVSSPAGGAGHGEVCRTGRNGVGGEARACDAGLDCYPCGVEGCDWVCETPSECEADLTRP